MEKQQINFEDFLMEKHCEENPQLLDDMLCDDFDTWISYLDPNDLISYGDMYVKECLRKERLKWKEKILKSFELLEKETYEE